MALSVAVLMAKQSRNICISTLTLRPSLCDRSGYFVRRRSGETEVPIGKPDDMLKRIGTVARKDIKSLSETRVFWSCS
jgi:hypothetical protein